MKTTEKTITEIYNLGNQEIKEKLQKEFPSLFKTTTELEKAIQNLGETDKEVIKLKKLDFLEDDDKLLVYQKLVTITKYLNNSWVRKEGETYYYPWFYLNTFRLNGVGDRSECSNAPSALCFKSEEVAQYAADNQEIFEYYKIVFGN